MIDRKKILQTLLVNKSEFAEKYGVTALGIFGSVARGESGNKSDLDVVVKMEKPDLYYLVHIKEALETATHTKVDIVHYRERMNLFLKDRIDKEAIYV